MAERVATLSNTRLVKTFGVAPRCHKDIIFGFLKILWVQICHKVIQKGLRFSKILQEYLFSNSLRLAMSLGKEDLIVERSLQSKILCTNCCEELQEDLLLDPFAVLFQSIGYFSRSLEHFGRIRTALCPWVEFFTEASIVVGSILVHEGERLEMFCWKRARDESSEN